MISPFTKYHVIVYKVLRHIMLPIVEWIKQNWYSSSTIHSLTSSKSLLLSIAGESAADSGTPESHSSSPSRQFARCCRSRLEWLEKEEQLQANHGENKNKIILIIILGSHIALYHIPRGISKHSVFSLHHSFSCSKHGRFACRSFAYGYERYEMEIAQ